MIGALKGTVFNKIRNPIIIMVSGVGYAVFITDKLRSLLKSGSAVTLFIHTHVRDDILALYGFTEQDELFMFELLQTVSGIGPRTALLVTDRGVKSIERAVSTSDVDFFTSIPRLGRKNAQKIIIELKNKLGSVKELDLSDVANTETKELIEVLTGMGFTQREALDAIKKIDLTLTIENKIKQALKLLGSNK